MAKSLHAKNEMIKKCLTTKRILQWINRALAILSVFLLGCLCVILVQALISGTWSIRVSTTGIRGLQTFWSEFSPIIKLLGFCLTLFVASHHLAKYLDVETVHALSKLREMLNSEAKKKIHNHLLDASDTPLIISELAKAAECERVAFSNIEIYDYIGTLELGAIMLKRGVISEDEFISQFGYRVLNLWNRPEIQERILRDHDYYEYFIEVSMLMKKFEKNIL